MRIPLTPCLQCYQCYSTMQSDWSSLLFSSFSHYQGGEDRPRLRHVGRADHALGRQQQHRAGHRGDRGHSCSLWKQCHCRQLPLLPWLHGLKWMVPRSARWGLWQPLALQSPLQMPLRWGLRVCWQELQPQAGERLKNNFLQKSNHSFFLSWCCLWPCSRCDWRLRHSRRRQRGWKENKTIKDGGISPSTI